MLRALDLADYLCFAIECEGVRSVEDDAEAVEIMTTVTKHAFFIELKDGIC